MKIFRVAWKVRDFTHQSKWYTRFDTANQFRSDLESAATILKVNFESRPQITEVEVEE